MTKNNNNNKNNNDDDDDLVIFRLLKPNEAKKEGKQAVKFTLVGWLK